MDETKRLADDMLRGVRAIADELGETERQVYYALEKGNLPAFKRGKIWCARKSTLRRRLDSEVA